MIGVELKEKHFEQEVFNRLIITSTTLGKSSTTVKRQILKHQAIVAHILDCHNCASIGWSNCRVYRRSLDKHGS